MGNIDFNTIVNLLTVLAFAAAVAGFMAGLLGCLLYTSDAADE